jgi:hypothetical protein
MGLVMTFPDVNEKVVLYGLEGLGDLFNNTNPNFERIGKLIVKASYNAVFLYGIAKGLFTSPEVKEHVDAHGFGLDLESDVLSPFMEKVIMLMQETLCRFRHNLPHAVPCNRRPHF